MHKKGRDLIAPAVEKEIKPDEKEGGTTTSNEKNLSRDIGVPARCRGLREM